MSLFIYVLGYLSIHYVHWIWFSFCSLHPEIDDTSFLDPIKNSLYRSLVGCTNWLVILGKFDIAYATNIFGRFGMRPREGHLTGIIRFF